LHLDAPVMSSTGPTKVYFDGIGACLCAECIPVIREFFEASLMQLAGAWPIACGASGALILGLLGRGTYLSSEGKLNGPTWRRLEDAVGRPVALVDDCTFSGATLRYLHRMAQEAGLQVAGEVVLLDARGRVLD
jgi:hypothetical protein